VVVKLKEKIEMPLREHEIIVFTTEERKRASCFNLKLHLRSGGND